MAKSTKQVPKTKKKKVTKYTKLALHASKELAGKKKALVAAEKRLAAAQKNHSELLAEVARLDMLDRSLKALIEGTEPPQNIRYVYTYPNWVWYPNQQWYPYGGSTITLNTTGSNGTYQVPTTQTITSNGNFQGGCFSNAVGVSNSGNISTFNLATANCGSSDGATGVTLSSTGTAPQWTTVNMTNSSPEMVVDLTTGATDDEGVFGDLLGTAAESAAEDGVEDPLLELVTK
jgi:hypothetical protein